MLIPNHACAQPQPAARNGREAVKSMGVPIQWLRRLRGSEFGKPAARLTLSNTYMSTSHPPRVRKRLVSPTRRRRTLRAPLISPHPPLSNIHPKIQSIVSRTSWTTTADPEGRIGRARASIPSRGWLLHSIRPRLCRASCMKSKSRKPSALRRSESSCRKTLHSLIGRYSISGTPSAHEVRPSSEKISGCRDRR